MIWGKIKKLASKPSFWPMVSALAAVIMAFIMLIKYFDEIVRFVSRVLNIIWGILNQLIWGILNQSLPIYIVLIIFVLIFIVFLLIRLKINKLSEREMFILGILDEREIRLSLLLKIYKQRFEEESRTISNCLVTVKQLEEKKLIKCEVFPGEINDIQEELFQLTKKGQKRFEKLDSIIREKAEDIYIEILSMPIMKPGGRVLKRIEPHKEIMFILELLAKQQNKSMRKTDLSNYYFKNFSNKKVLDFNIVWNRLETGNLIVEYRYSVGYEIPDIYCITDNGLVYLRTYKENEV